MQSLISGAECATTSNPLSQVLKHTEEDRSLQRDRIEGPSTPTLQRLPHSVVHHANMADLAMARQFFDSGPILNNVPMHTSPSASSRRVLESLHTVSGPRPPATGPGILIPVINASSSISTNISNWSEEFKYLPQTTSGTAQPRFSDTQTLLRYPLSNHNVPSTIFQQHVQGSMGLNWDQAFSRLDAKGKGKAVDADFEAAFARAAAAIPEGNSHIVEINDEAESLEAAFERTRLAGPDGKQEERLISDFEKVWEQLRNSDLPPPAADIAKWEAEFNQLMESERDSLGYVENFENWKDEYGEGFHPPAPIEYEEDGIPLLDPYKFELSNPYMAKPSNHLARAKELIMKNGSLTEIALLLEAAIQHGELGEGDYEAWLLLGETRSMDEREGAAMRALREGVQRAQKAGNYDAGMISLAISYTNESFDRASHTILLQWLIAKYPEIVPDNMKGRPPNSQWALHDWAIEAFLSVARHQHARGDMDPDVQIALGVLFYTNMQFDKAKDCFESALAVRPKDYLLWNRLGSCLSNGSKPEEALNVYREALQLRPTYTRAIYNVGVACLNIGAYKEAAEHFLSALAMQESSGGEKSEQLWQTLRKCFAAMERNDLAEAAKAGQNLDFFRGENFEF